MPVPKDGTGEPMSLTSTGTSSAPKLVGPLGDVSKGFWRGRLSTSYPTLLGGGRALGSRLGAFTAFDTGTDAAGGTKYAPLYAALPPGAYAARSCRGAYVWMPIAVDPPAYRPTSTSGARPPPKLEPESRSPKGFVEAMLTVGFSYAVSNIAGPPPPSGVEPMSMKLGIALRKRRFEFQPKTRMRIIAVLMSRNSPAVSSGSPLRSREIGTESRTAQHGDGHSEREETVARHE